MKEWLLNLPCVLRGEVIVDVRGPWPTMIIGMRAASVESKDDAIMFLVLNLD